jgi:hypothetical protein
VEPLAFHLRRNTFSVVRGVFLSPKSYRLEVLPNDEVVTNPDGFKFSIPLDEDALSNPDAPIFAKRLEFFPSYTTSDALSSTGNSEVYLLNSEVYLLNELNSEV